MITLIYSCLYLFYCMDYTFCGRSVACSNSDSYYFNMQPKGITVREGGRAFLECNVSNRCNIHFQWTLNEKIIHNTTRRYQNGSNLVITRVNRTLDTGDFHCVTTMIDTGVAKESQAAQLLILWLSESVSVDVVDPSIKSKLETGLGVDRLHLLCNAQGSGDISYKWFYNGRRVRRGVGGRLVAKHDRLTLSNVTFNDNGVYSCVVENLFATRSSDKNFVLTIKDDDIASIRVYPKDTVMSPSSTVHIDCAYDRALDVRWRNVQHEQFIPKQGRVYQSSNNSLVISQASKDDQGAYECMGYGRNVSLPPQSFVAVATLAYLDEFRSTSFEPVQHMYVVGETKLFQVACIPPNGYPTPQAYWTLDGQPLTASGRVRADRLRLVIDSAKAEDGGEYVCRAENMAGYKESTLTLGVSHPPTITYHPASLSLDEGERAVFQCRFKGSPYPMTTVDWLRNGSALEGDGSRVLVIGYNGTLVINALRISDMADYSCLIKTLDQTQVQSKEASLIVKAKLKFLPVPVDKKLELGSSNRIVCSASGHNGARVRWLKVAEIDANGTVTKRYKQPIITFPQNIRDKDGTLFFHDIQFVDAGVYMCTAVNSQGFINASIKVEVVISPQFTLVPDNGTYSEAGDVWLHCAAKGSPPPHTQWYFDGVPVGEGNIPFSNYAVYKNNTLALKSVNRLNAGKYMCMVGNKAGFAKQEALLCIRISTTNFTHCGRQLGFQQFGNGPFGGSRNPEGVGEGHVSSKTIGTAVGVAAGYLVLMIILISWCSWRRRRNNKHAITANGSESRTVVLPSQAGCELREPLTNGHWVSDRPASVLTPSLVGGEGTRSHSPPTCATSSNWTEKFTRDKIDPASMKRLGGGVYGDVYIATAHRVKPDESASLVLVKTLLTKDETIHGQLREEMEMFGKTDHPNLAKFLALFSDVEPILVVYDYYAYGNLKRYMTSSRHYWSNGSSKDQYPIPLTPENIVWIGYQVAQGMEHLADARFVHKDIAARNVVVNEGMDAKITSLSLQNDLFVQEYFIYKNLYFPLRWMPAEALLDDDFSMKSDVYSYAVFLWELYCCGELPFQLFSNEEIIEKLKGNELTLTPPPLTLQCHPAVAELMVRCWHVDPRKRPNFTEIRDIIGQAHVETGL